MKQSILIVASLFVIFFSGFFAGKIFSKDWYSSAHNRFQGHVDELRDQIQHIEFVNRKLRKAFDAVHAKNDQIESKAQTIREKEAEISKLTQRIARETDPKLRARLEAELAEKRHELDLLRKEYNTLRQQAVAAHENLSHTNKLLKEKDEQIVKLNQQLSKNENQNSRQVKKTKKEIARIKDQLAQYREGSRLEELGDSYKGKNRRKNRSKLYRQAYEYYKQAEAEYDMKRVYEKIKVRKIKKTIQQEN